MFTLHKGIQGRQPIYTFSQGYDAAGNVTGVNDSVMGEWNFGYDHLNRLSSAAGVSGSYNGVSIAGRTLTWTYDSFGNRNVQTPSTGAPFPAEHAYYNPANNQLTSSNFTGQLAYDDAGNIKFDGLNYYALDSESRVCALKNIATGDSWTNIYDASGHRVAKGRVNNGASCYASGNGYGAPNYSTTVMGQSGEQVSELDSTNTLLHLNVYANGELLATYDRAGLHFPLSDWLGTVRTQASYTGAVEQTWQSLPFGDGLIPMVEGASEHHYTGQLYDQESGLDYFQARFHSGVMGRFTSPDDGSDQSPGDPQSWNLYSYVRNNPLTNTDPDGHECIINADLSMKDGIAGGESCADVVHNNAVNPVVSARVTANYSQDERIQMLANNVDMFTDRYSLSRTAYNGLLGAQAAMGIGELGAGLASAGGEVANATANATTQAIDRATISNVVASSEKAASSQISQGARAIAKKAGHAASGGFDSAFNGIPATQQNATALIRDILSNPSAVVKGGMTTDVYNAAGQGVRFQTATHQFVTFLEGGLRTR